MRRSIDFLAGCWLVVVQLLSYARLFVTPWAAAHQASLCPSLSWSLLKFKSTESVILSKHLILCCPLLLLPSIFPSIRVPSNELALHLRWPKYWSFSISPSNEYSWFISLGLTARSPYSPKDSKSLYWFIASRLQIHPFCLL